MAEKKYRDIFKTYSEQLHFAQRKCIQRQKTRLDSTVQIRYST